MIDKPGKGAFYATELQDVLTAAGITQLLVTGVTTEVCVHTTTREANDRGYECLVVSDCVGSYFPEFQRVGGLEMIKAQGGAFSGGSPTPLRSFPRCNNSPRTPPERPPKGSSHVHRRHRSPPPAPIPPAEKAQPRLSIPWWTRGDTNAFFGLGFNILVNVLTLTGLMIGVVKVPPGDVLGTILPALGVALILGNLYYTFLARRLAKRENRTDVTALPYGPVCRICSSSSSW